MHTFVYVPSRQPEFEFLGNSERKQVLNLLGTATLISRKVVSAMNQSTHFPTSLVKLVCLDVDECKLRACLTSEFVNLLDLN